MVTSFIQLIKFVDDFASQHQQIQRFRAEFEEQMPNFATETEAYPILFMAPVGSQFAYNQDTYTVRFYAFDIIQKDRANINFILSDTNLILNDLKKWFQDGDNYTFDILGDPTAIPINNALLDYAAGWQMDITFNVDTYCVDEIPFKNSPLIPVEGYDVVYSRYLTCETVTGCTSFQEYIENALSNFTGGTSTDQYWISGSTGFFSVKTINDSGLDATNDYALAEGFGTIAQGYASHAEGNMTTASGTNSHAEGEGSVATRLAAHAEGYYTSASGSYSHAEGEGSIASGQTSHAEGRMTVAAGTNSHAEGNATIASGNNSHSEGENTTASGRASHAEGVGTKAEGGNSHAGGEKTIAKGQNSFVHGSGSVANGSSTIVLGDNITGIDDNTVYVPNIQFDLGAPSTMDVGRMEWNDEDGTVDLRLKGNNVTLQLGQEQVIRVVNKTGADLLESEYKVVRVRTAAEGGAQGQRLAVVLAQADTKANHNGVLGVVTENIKNNQEGFITSFGQVRNINTTGSLQSETWSDGDDLYLSETNAGGLTNIEPDIHPVRIGYVLYAHTNNGKIFVSVDNGVDELEELHDVKISGSTSNGQWLEYDSSLSAWTNTSAFDFSLNFISDFTYPIILPYNWLIDSVDNPSSIGVSLSATSGTYTLGTNISAFTETLTVSAATSGFINLNCRRLG